MARNWRKVPWHLRYRTGAQIASTMRRLTVSATHLHCRVEFHGPVRIGPGFVLDIPDNGEFIVGAGVDFRRGFVCEISGSGRVTIGAGSIFTSTALIQCTTSIDIGQRCVFGQATMIADGNHRFRDPDLHLLDQGYDFRPITIGDGAVVTSKCTIVASLGERALVGANSVVNRDVPAYCLAAGVPARVIEYFGPPERRPDVITTQDG
jgi:acetyltransferase-like isoleucine patch superfamily enzyme